MANVDLRASANGLGKGESAMAVLGCLQLLPEKCTNMGKSHEFSAVMWEHIGTSC